MASRLAKYMDNGSLLVEGALSGRVGTYECPIALKLFGTSDPMERANLRNQMKSDKLPCQLIDEREKEAKKRKREDLVKIAAAKKAEMGGKGAIRAGEPQWSQSQGEWSGVGSQGDKMSSFQSLEDIMETTQAFNPRDMGKHSFVFLLFDSDP